MRETVEFRIPEEHAARFLGTSRGVTLGGTVRKIVVGVDDPLFRRIGELDRALHAQGRAFFTAWIPRRKYTAAEVSAAEAFQLKVCTVFEPAGEECGTAYDYSDACPRCGFGRRQRTELMLDPRRMPRSKDVARTIGDELVVSARVADLLRREGIRGIGTAPIRSQRDTRRLVSGWFQLSLSGGLVRMVPPTRCGNDPFDLDEEGQYRCPDGHVVGLNALSELFIARQDFEGVDVAETSSAVGVRGGLLVPSPLCVVSGRLGRLLLQHKVRGAVLEVAHLVP